MIGETEHRDPTDSGELQSRLQSILQKRSKEPIRNRNAYLGLIAESRRVLDVGIIDHFAARANSENWLHQVLSKAATYCVGVDVLESEIEKLRAQGWHVRTLDITEERLDDSFDLIVCGEIVEHVSNPGRLLENCRAMLAPGGKLLITAPNPWFLTVTLKNSIGRSLYLNNVDHIAWFDPTTFAELGLRHGLELTCYRPLIDLRLSSWTARAIFTVARLFSPWLIKPEVFAISIIYEFVLFEDP